MTTAHPAPTRLRDAVQLWAVAKTYGSGEQAVTALDRVTLSFPRGTFTAIMGPSGSGKSTLLQCAAGLDRPGDGQVLIGDTELSRLTEKQLTLLRRERIGFVFQAFNLLTALTAAQNVALPLRLAGRKIEPGRVEAALGAVGLGDRARHRPGEMSGGQQQRVAIARALVADPEVIFADEPTGALDTNTSREVLGLLRRVVDAHGQTVIMVTHDPVAAAFADRVVYLADGRIADEYVADRRDHGERAQVIAARMAQLEAVPGGKAGGETAEETRVPEGAWNRSPVPAGMHEGTHAGVHESRREWTGVRGAEPYREGNQEGKRSPLPHGQRDVHPVPGAARGSAAFQAGNQNPVPFTGSEPRGNQNPVPPSAHGLPRDATESQNRTPLPPSHKGTDALPAGAPGSPAGFDSGNRSPLPPSHHDTPTAPLPTGVSGDPAAFRNGNRPPLPPAASGPGRDPAAPGTGEPAAGPGHPHSASAVHPGVQPGVHPGTPAVTPSAAPTRPIREKGAW